MPRTVFTCKVCRSKVEAHGEPKVQCRACKTVYRRVGKPGQLGTLVGTSLAGAVLGAIIYGQIPLPGESVEKKAEKVTKIIGAMTAGGFTAFIAHELVKGGV